jgi:hypothetical protein
LNIDKIRIRDVDNHLQLIKHVRSKLKMASFERLPPYSFASLEVIVRAQMS